jgi:fumarate reductase flavoprotein subunit
VATAAPGETSDLLIVGAGTAGIPAAIFAARGGASVTVIDAADAIGGTLHLSAGQISAASTPAQRRRGIDDDPERHFADIMRISRDTANAALTRLAVDHVSDMLAWLVESGLDLPASHPVIDPVNEPYSRPRTYWHPDGGRAILRAIVPQFEAERDRGAMALHLGTRLRDLIVENGRVVGVRAETDGVMRAFRARSVVLTTGGFTADAPMFARMTNGRARHGSGYSFARGDGLAAALDAGGIVANVDLFLPAFAAVENPDARDGYSFDTRTDPANRPPWELYVDLDGRRFMREDEPDLNTRQRALLGLRDLRFWAIYDARTMREGPPFPSRGWQALEGRFAAGLPGYARGDTVAELAGHMQADPVVLAQTIAAYNAAVTLAQPDPFGRVHRPGTVAEPYHAIRHSGWSPTGFAGLAVDESLRVVGADDQPIPGLYAAGEILGMAATAGRSFCSGMSLGPALTFGRLLGQRPWAGTD